MPMMPQQQMPQPAQRQMPQPTQGQATPQQQGGYPSNPKEIEQVKTNAVKLIYSQGIREMITKALTITDTDKLTKTLAAITAKVLQVLVTDIPKKTGRKPKLSMVANMAKFILSEIKMIAMKVKVKIPGKVFQQAGMMSGQILEQTFSQMSQQKRQGGAPQASQPPGAVPPQAAMPQQQAAPPQQTMPQQPSGLLGAAIPRG